MAEHRYDIRISESCVDPNPLMIEKQDPDNFPRFKTRERCALEIAAYVFKGTVDSCLFLTAIRNATPKCSGDILISYMEVYAFFLQEWTLQKNCNVIRFLGNQKYQKTIHGNDIKDALSRSTAIF